jgi:ABC-type amino acid transport substrate-binding protein
MFSLFLAVHAHAEVIITGSPSWKGFTSPDGQGLYHDLMRAVFEERGNSVRHLEVPAKRGVVMLRDGQIDVYICDTAAAPGMQLAETPMYEGEFHALFLSGAYPNWNGVESMAGRLLVWRLGYYSPEDFPVAVRFEETTTGIDALNRVVHGSADFYIDDVNLILETVRDYPSALDAKEYRIESVGFRQYFPMFARSSRGNELRRAFEEGMRSLAAQDRLRQAYEKWGLPMPRAYSLSGR